MTLSRLRNILLALLLLPAPALMAVDYTNLTWFEDYPCTNASPKHYSLLRREWHAFRSSARNSLVSDNLNTDLFWNSARAALQDGTFYNRLANAEVMGENGTDLVLKALYASIKQVPVVYHTCTPQGDTILASGKIFLPREKRAKNIILANHYTICANSEAPGNACSIEGIFATKGYIVVMADYIGYGITDSLPHPYLTLQNNVNAGLDLLKVAIPYLCANDYTYYPNLILLGYSRGGALTLAMQKTIEEDYADTYTIDRVYAGAGPYDLSATFDFYISGNTTDISCTLPMIITGMNYGENLNLREEDFFQPLMTELYPFWIGSRLKNIYEVNAALGNKIDKLLKPVIFHPEQYPTSVLYRAVWRNNIVHVGPRRAPDSVTPPVWIPRSDLYLFHSTEDNWVPFLNSEHLRREFQQLGVDNVEYDFAPYGNHMNAAVTFFEKVYRML